MTVEVEQTVSKMLGLRKETVRRVMEYRIIEKVEPHETSRKKRDLVILSQVQSDPDSGTSLDISNTFAHAISEDELEVYDTDWIFHTTATRRYSGEEINQANISGGKNNLRIVWRETKPEDYPEPEAGWQVSPIQLNLKLF